MDVATITMPPDAARAKLDEYRAALRRKSDTQYERAAAAYAALAAGTPVLILSQAFADCPRDAKGRPAIAVARADRRVVRYGRSWRNSALEVFDSTVAQRRGRAAVDGVIEVASGVRAPDRYVSGYAQVPMVPPLVARGHDLTKRFILWEVERWVDDRRELLPDRDPYLLARLAPDCYAVVGEWDLTDVERAILRGRDREA